MSWNGKSDLEFLSFSHMPNHVTSHDPYHVIYHMTSNKHGYYVIGLDYDITDDITSPRPWVEVVLIDKF